MLSASFFMAGLSLWLKLHFVDLLHVYRGYGDSQGYVFPRVFFCRYGVGGWLGSRMVSVLDSGAEGPGFRSQSRRCRLTVLGKLFTAIVPLFTEQQNL